MLVHNQKIQINVDKFLQLNLIHSAILFGYALKMQMRLMKMQMRVMKMQMRVMKIKMRVMKMQMIVMTQSFLRLLISILIQIYYHTQKVSLQITHKILKPSHNMSEVLTLKTIVQKCTQIPFHSLQNL